MGEYETNVISFENYKNDLMASEAGTATAEQVADVAAWEAVKKWLAHPSFIETSFLEEVYVHDDGLIMISMLIKPDIKKLLKKKSLLKVFKRTPKQPSLELSTVEASSAEERGE